MKFFETIFANIIGALVTASLIYAIRNRNELRLSSTSVLIGLQIITAVAMLAGGFYTWPFIYRFLVSFAYFIVCMIEFGVKKTVPSRIDLILGFALPVLVLILTIVDLKLTVTIHK